MSCTSDHPSCHHACHFRSHRCWKLGSASARRTGQRLRWIRQSRPDCSVQIAAWCRVERHGDRGEIAVRARSRTMSMIIVAGQAILVVPLPIGRRCRAPTWRNPLRYIHVSLYTEQNIKDISESRTRPTTSDSTRGGTTRGYIVYKKPAPRAPHAAACRNHMA